MNDKKFLFEKDSIPHALGVMAFPAIASQLITLIYNLADTWFVGRTNNPYMVASCSLVLPVYMLTIVISNIFGVGGGTLIARLIGKGEDDEASRVSAACIWMALGLGLAFSLICFFVMTPFLIFLGASDNVLEYSRQYMFFVVVLGGIPAIFSNTVSSMLRSIGLSSKASFGLSMGGVLNIILDPIFMFVILPDGRQVMGAALATMLSNLVVAVYFNIIYKKSEKDTILRLRMKGEYPSRESFSAIFGVGIPAAVGVLLFDLCNIVINRLSASYGDIELAAIGIVLKTERLPLNIGIGICLGMVPLLAYSYSSGNRKRMDEFFRFGRVVGLGIGITCVILYYVFAPVIMQAFIGDTETVRYGTMFLRARCFATPLMFLCFSMVHFTQAIGRGNASFWLAVIRQIVFNIPILFLFNRLFGVMGIVWTQIVADIFTVIVSYIIYAGIRKSEGWPAGL
ncbi:putative efflux protein, MATE family [Lachnospiraceae bacterium JC7]|nr:putative efflux protein, MATE family [Lachnospiraceae bacterium JC7]